MEACCGGGREQDLTAYGEQLAVEGAYANGVGAARIHSGREGKATREKRGGVF
jgi:hypothetical protein